MAGLYSSTDFVPSWALNTPAYSNTPPVASEPAPVANYGGGDSQIARGIRSAFTGAKASLQGFGGTGAELLGADDYARQMYEDALANERLAAKQAPRVGSIRQVMESENPLMAGVDYTAGMVGQVAPYMLLGGAGALVGRGAGLAGGLRQGLAGEALAARAAAGANLGGAAAIHPVMAGQQATQMYSDPAAQDMSVGERALRANVVGGVQSAANALAPAAMVNQTFVRGAPQGFFRRTVGNMALEGTGESAEDIVGQAHRTTYDPNYQINPKQTAENFAAGFIGASPVAGVHSAVTNSADHTNDVAGRGIEALSAGAKWVGQEAYAAMPDQIKQVADVVAQTGQMTADAAEALKPYLKATAAVGQDALNQYNQRVDTIGENDSTMESLSKRYAATVEGAAAAYEGLSQIAEHAVGKLSEQGKKALDAFTEQGADYDTAKKNVSGARTQLDRLSKVAEVFSDPAKWVGEDEKMTPARLKALGAAAQQPQRLREYTDELIDFIDGTGQDTPAAQELRAYAERMSRGENLSPGDVQNLWLKAKIATEVERTSENLDALWSMKGVKMKATGGKVEVENLSRQKDVVNKAVREALANAKTDPELAKGIARRIQTKDVLTLGADRAVRHAVGDELAARGIDPKANNTFTEMYNRVLEAVNEQVGALKEEGVIPEVSRDDLPPKFSTDVREAFTEMLQATEAGREMAKSQKLMDKHIEGLMDYVMKLASGDLGDHAAVKLKTQLEKVYGEAGTNAVNRIVDAAAAAFGGLGDSQAERVHGLMNLNKTLHQSAAEIRAMLKYDDVDINALLDEIETAREFDAKRSELPRLAREMRQRVKELPVGSNERYELEGKLLKIKSLMEDGATGFSALKNKWVSQNIVSPRKFDAVVSALESYSRHPDQLTRPEKRAASSSSAANHVAEDENDFETLQNDANVEGEDGEEPIRQFDLDGKRDGESRQEYLDKRRSEKYGHALDNEDRKPPIYWGANAFEEGGHDAKVVTAPVTRHESGEYENGSEYGAAIESAHAKYGHRVTKAHAVSVQRWAAETAATQNTSERSLLNQAMKALLAHDQKRLGNEKLTTTDKNWIQARADLAEKLGTRGDAGEKFFQHSMNRNYRYYKMEQSDASNLSYSRDWLEATAALRTKGDVTEDRGAYVERMQKRDGGKFSDKVYEQSLLPVTTTDGKTITVDIAKLVGDALAQHQPADITGVGEKKVERNLSNEIVTAFHNVMAALMTADGIESVGRKFASEDAANKWNEHFDPSMVIFRDPTGRVLQEGEHVLSHSTKRAYTLGELTKIAGFDPQTMRTQFKDKINGKATSPGIFSDEDMATIFRPEKGRERAADVEGKGALGVAYRGAVMDGKPVSVDLHHMLSRMLERNGIDPHEAMQQGTLPTKLAGMLLREAFLEAKARGVEMFDGFSSKYDNVAVYQRHYGDESYPVTLKELKSIIANPDANAPRNLRDAKIQEALERLQKADQVEKDIVDRQKRGASLVADKIPEARQKVGAAIDNEVDETNFLYGQPGGQDYSGAKLKARIVDGEIVKEREQGDTPRFSVDEGENMRIQQILKELGEDAQGDAPLFDKTEAFGTTGGKEWERQKRPTEKQEFFGEDFEGPRKPRDEAPDYVQGLYKRLQEVAAGDPQAAKFLKDTFHMDFDSKEFSSLMERRATARNKIARAQNDKGAADVVPGKTPSSLTLTEQRANAKMTVQTLATNEQSIANANRASTIETAAKNARAALEAEKAAKVAETEPEIAETTPAKPVEPTTLERFAQPAKSPGDSIKIINALDDAALKDLLLNLPAKPEKGTIAEQARNLLYKNDMMKDWADAQFKRAGLTRESLGNVPFSKQRTVETPAAGAPSEVELRAEIDRLLGEGKVDLKMPIEVLDEKGNGVSGKYDDKLKQILVSAVAADRMGVAHHETWHRIEALLGDMGEHGKRVLDEVRKYANSTQVQRWLHEQYTDDEGVLSQLGSPAERASFVFQKFMAGEKAPGIEKTTYQRFGDWIRDLLGKLGFETSTNTERAENFFEYVKKGEFARDVENAISVRKGLGEKNGDNLMRTAAETIKPVMEGLDKVFGHTSTRVHKLGIPEYSKIVEMFGGQSGKGGYQLDKHRFENKFGNRIGELLGGKTAAEQQALLSSGGLDGVLRDMSNYMQQAGVDAKTRSNLYSRLDAFNSDKIADNMEDFITDLVQHGGFKGKAGEARKIANDIADHGYFYDPDLKLFEKRADIAEKWLERDVIEKMSRYVERATYIAEQTRHFGPTKEYTTPAGVKYREPEKLHDLLEAGDQNASPEGRQLVRDYIDAMNGRYGGRLSPEMRKLQGGLLFAQNVHVLPMAVFSQMLEPMQLALRRNTLRGSLDSLFRGIRDMPKTFDAVNKRVAPTKWLQMSQEVGAAPGRIIRHTMTNLMNGTHVGGKIGEWNDRFFKYNFMDQWNRSMHGEGVRHAVEFLREQKESVEKDMGGQDKDGALRAKRFLKELGLDASDIQFDKAGDLILNDKVERGIVQFVEEAMAHPDAGSNALWMNDPRFALLAQMKRFTFAHTKYILDRGIKEVKLGNAFPLAPAILAMPWMMAADGLRDAISGSEGYQAKSALDYAVHAAERANHFGRGQFGLDALNAVGRGGSPVEALGGPSVEMFGNIARGAHEGKLIEAMIEYTPGAPLMQVF